MGKKNTIPKYKFNFEGDNEKEIKESKSKITKEVQNNYK